MIRKLVAPLLLALSAPAFATTYEVDAAHSQIGFSITCRRRKRLGL